MDFAAVKLYTDSQITLDWINGNPKRWKTFVQNKVVAINKIFPKENWCKVSTKHNPADCATRGLSPIEFFQNALWFNGPEFLKISNATIPQDSQKESVKFNIASEENTKFLALNVAVHENFLPCASSIFKMKKGVAYCIRFINNCKNSSTKRIR